MRNLAPSVRKMMEKTAHKQKLKLEVLNTKTAVGCFNEAFKKLELISRSRRVLYGWAEPALSGFPFWPFGSYSSAGGRSGRWTAVALRSVSAAAPLPSLPPPRSRLLVETGGDAPGSSSVETSGCCQSGDLRRRCPRRRPLWGAHRPVAASGGGRCHPTSRGGSAVCRRRDEGARTGGPRRGEGAGGLASWPATRGARLDHIHTFKYQSNSH